MHSYEYPVTVSELEPFDAFITTFNLYEYPLTTVLVPSVAIYDVDADAFHDEL